MSTITDVFEKEVLLKYRVYNSLFLTLPIDEVSDTGHLLPLLNDHCMTLLEKHKSPAEIIESFFENLPETLKPEEQYDFLFRIIQYVERQVVLIDALEDAAFLAIHSSDQGLGYEKLKDLPEEQKSQVQEFLQNFGVRFVLTAHPTQFYPGTVLGILNDLTNAVKANDLEEIRQLLLQLGNTPFFRKEKPTPLSEAINLSWFLEHVFYHAAGDLRKGLKETGLIDGNKNFRMIQFGFWPGGDRDGNAYVNSETTLSVSKRLREVLFRCYYREIRAMKRRLTFHEVYDRLVEMEKKVYPVIFSNDTEVIPVIAFLKEQLEEISDILKRRYKGLFLDYVVALHERIETFGGFLATLDIRQDSRVIGRSFENWLACNAVKIPDNAEEIFALEIAPLTNLPEDEVEQDSAKSFATIQEIQDGLGELACHRFIISNCRSVDDIARVFAMAKNQGLEGRIDVVPLFETIEDLKLAGQHMEDLFQTNVYMEHLKKREMKQTVMLGFSDGTKDGGYLSANWNIFRAKEDISSVARKYGLKVIFFDGRGGPPARGGGNTKKFFSSLGNTVDNHELHMTIQGQTISSQYGTRDAAVYNMATLLGAGITNKLRSEQSLDNAEEDLLTELSEYSRDKYLELKDSDSFMPYLEKVSPLKFYGQTNIASRPAKRGKSEGIKFEDLRAIPFVSSWSQLKQNVPGYFGLGTALKKLKDQGRFIEACRLHNKSHFFQALIENSMQSLAKCDFAFTAYLQKDKEFGDFWKSLYDEYQLTHSMILELSGQKKLLESNPVARMSIELRQEVIVPLLTIQQYALEALRKGHGDKEVMENLVIRSMFGNINATRNSA
jgi:phosphoenolpyruvate carboxylase